MKSKTGQRTCGLERRWSELRGRRWLITAIEAAILLVAGPGGPSRDGLPPGGHGLIGLRERAELLGGDLRAAPTDTGGFDLLITLGARPDPGTPT